MSFFHTFHEKPLLTCPYLVKKNVKSAKTRLYFGPKKSKECLSFRHFTKKSLFSYPNIAIDNVHSLNTRCFHANIFQKYVHYLKNMVLSCHFFQFFMKILMFSCPDLFQKRVFCQNYNILGAKNVNRILFFSDFLRKNHCFHAHIFSTKRPFSRKTLLQCPCCDKKTFILLKTQCSHVMFSNFS